MATRSTFSNASAQVPWKNTGSYPEGFGDQYARHVKTLYDASTLPLTDVAGTADDVTASVDPVLDAGLLDGMKFTLTWAQDNTGPMTLALNGGSPADVLDAAGGVMAAGSALAGTRALLEYIAGAFRVLSGSGSGSGSQRGVWVYAASATWEKPAWLDDDTPVFVEAWGGGGAGGGNTYGGGGGGGGYSASWFRAGDLPSNVAIAIGAGGEVGNPSTAGGTTTFGTMLTAWGGGRGGRHAGEGGGQAGGGGGGGSQLTATGPAGVNATSNNGGAGGTSSTGANGGKGYGSNNGAAAPGDPALNEFGGGGGGGGRAALQSQGVGGDAVRGGGGGGGQGASSTPAGGVSAYGGSGGAAGEPGQVPGGGGGTQAPGARGEVRIWI